MKIFIVEDDKEINDLLAEYLISKGYEVRSLYDGRKVVETMEQEKADMVLLDIMLPYKSGDSILEEIRKTSMLPVIILSAKDTTQNKVDLLRLGADDYITKPFDMEEVLARIESALRRSGFQAGGTAVPEYKGLKIDPENKTVSLDGTELSLTAKEYAILELLLKYPQKVFSKANLFESVWGEEYIAEDNALNVHISNLRNKLKVIRPGQDYIDTVWGIGFRLHKDK